jgi:ubiquinone/menaquinone biosynthesis C-methylase UbiE
MINIFPKQGTLLETGCGTSQTSIKIAKTGRKYIAIDISEEALEEAKNIKIFDEFVKSDIRKLPCENNSVEGIWNLGVMEHFLPEDIQQILMETNRVLKKGKVAILFWPYRYAPYQILLKSISKIGKIFGKKITFFPDEPSQLSSKKQAKQFVMKAGFSECIVHYNMRDIFSYMVVVCIK